MNHDRNAFITAYRALHGGSEIEAERALRGVELAYAEQQNTELQQALDAADGEHLNHTKNLRLQVEVLGRILEAFPDKHARFGYLTPDGAYVEAEKCADWCYACKLESLQTSFEAIRTTNRRLNRRAQKLEAELAAYRRAVDQWEVDKRGTYIPLRTIAAIAKAAGRVIENPHWLLHYERIEQAEKCINAARNLHQPIDGEGGPYCGTCTQEERQPQPIGWWVPFPCPTIQALEPERPAG